VNYRANIYAAKSLGVERIVAWTGPGAISRMYRPGDLVLPDDLLDFTRNRPSTFYEGKGIGFLRQFPVFCETLREALRSAWGSREGGKRRAESYISAERTPAPRGRASRPRRDPVPRARRGGSRRDDPVPRGVPRAGAGNLLRAGGVRDELRGGVRENAVRPGALFEGMLPPGEAAAVEAAKNAIPGIAIAAARAVAGEERDCPCAVSMERYRKRGVIGPDFRGWVAGPKGAGR